MGLRPRGLSTQLGPKETAQMRKYAPLAASIALLVTAILGSDFTYWP